MARTRKYHVFLVRYNGRWEQEFGDYNLHVVKQEREDFTTCHDILARDCKIVSCGDSQRAINKTIEALNSSL